MAKRLIECVPNFSEGRRKDVIESIVAPFKATKGCYLFDYRADEDHNRLVVSLVGEPEAIGDALVEAALTARDAIDMNAHQGGHPRIGAVDVIPFTPISNITMEECVTLSHDSAGATRPRRPSPSTSTRRRPSVPSARGWR